MTCPQMPFFPTNFLFQTSYDAQVEHHNNPQDFHGEGVSSYLGKRSCMSFCGEEDYLSDDDTSSVVGLGEKKKKKKKKRRLSIEQVKTLENNFEMGNKLEADRKLQLAKALGLQPRRIAVWFQNRRARWKTKQLEKDYQLLKTRSDAVIAQNEALHAQNQRLHAEIEAMKKRDCSPQRIHSSATRARSPVHFENDTSTCIYNHLKEEERCLCNMLAACSGNIQQEEEEEDQSAAAPGFWPWFQ